MRLSREVWIILVMLALLAVPSVLMVRQQQTQAQKLPMRTSYHTSSEGLKALYLTLEKLGYRVERLRRAPQTVQGKGIVFLVEPFENITEEEWQHLLGWVSEGNLLIVTSEQTKAVGDFNPLPFAAARSSARPSQAFPLLYGVRRYPILSRIRLSPKPWRPYRLEDCCINPFRRLGGMSMPHRDRAVSSQHVNVGKELVLLKDNSGIIAKAVSVGGGWVVVHASPFSFSNGGLLKGDNLRFVLNAASLFAPPGEGTIWFDEFHHGYQDDVGLWAMMGTKLRFAVMQVLAAIILTLLCAARRFGAPLPSPLEGPRTRSEYLDGMTLLFKRAQATRAALPLLRMQFLREALSSPRMLKAPNVDEIVGQLVTLPTPEAEAIATVIDESNRLEKQVKIDEATLLRLAVKMREATRKRRRAGE